MQMNQKFRFSILTVFSLVFSVFYLWQETAEARLGRGRSFGSRPSYQRSAPPPTQAPDSFQNKTGQTTPQQPSPSSTSRWKGILGGVIAGGLIGSLLFGAGQGFGGPGLLDLLLIGGGLFLLFRFLRAKKMATQGAFASAEGTTAYERSPDQSWGGLNDAAKEESAVTPPPVLPPGFDAEEFLEGANAAFVRLQGAWDKRDLADIRQFTSSEVFAEIEQQAKEDPQPGKTELLFINPQLVEVRDLDHQRVATVLFDVTLRENGETFSKQVRELWHFSQEPNTPQSFWKLEGIQQVEK